MARLQWLNFEALDDIPASRNEKHVRRAGAKYMKRAVLTAYQRKRKRNRVAGEMLFSRWVDWRRV
ncbi:hypothetical protein RBA41_27875 [Massilia sp. CCM 9210]|uniref:hypothetical protein n=1 Tax=Massilia scottii TaxID=3057166 RepID=UPI002796D80C|nr:hypothetical protein [Massilia sp. CCM 9210]MDQ1817131.1 hypothetical protein [Massilia sp. CCM 9210]